VITYSLVQAIEKFAGVTHSLTEDDLERQWAWGDYNEGVRFAFLRTYEELRQLAADMVAERASSGRPMTTAQRALAQYHCAYRDFQAVLIGVEHQLLDTSPAEGEWPLRVILGHIIAAEREFFSRIWFAVQEYRDEAAEIIPMTDEQVEEFVGSYEAFERSVERLSKAGIMAYYDTLHKRVLRELADIRAFELEAPSIYWETEPQTVQFRLHRIDSHLRQHTIQAEKTLAALVGPPTEAMRLLRLIYAALADVDGVIIGFWALGRENRRALASQIASRADEISVIVKS
jgi:hypothetical protein